MSSERYAILPSVLCTTERAGEGAHQRRRHKRFSNNKQDSRSIYFPDTRIPTRSHSTYYVHVPLVCPYFVRCCCCHCRLCTAFWWMWNLYFFSTRVDKVFFFAAFFSFFRFCRCFFRSAFLFARSFCLSLLLFAVSSIMSSSSSSSFLHEELCRIFFSLHLISFYTSSEPRIYAKKRNHIECAHTQPTTNNNNNDDDGGGDDDEKNAFTFSRLVEKHYERKRDRAMTR